MKSGNRIAVMVGLGIIAVVVIGLLFFPTIFYDHFIWKYLWGPIKADAAGHPVEWQGIWVKEGYTLVSEIIYGSLLVFALIGIYKLFKRLQVTISTSFFFAIFPYVVLGPVARVLEDSGLYNPPLVYWFISPVIYLLIAIFFFGSFFFSLFLERSQISQKTKLLYFSCGLIFINIFYGLAYLFWRDLCQYFVTPLIVLIFSIVPFLIMLYFLRQEKLHFTIPLFSLGILYLSPAVYLTARWISGFPWGESGDTYFSVLPIVLSLIVITLVFIQFFAKKHLLPISLSGINLLLIIGHMLDGWTSYVAVKDPFNLGLVYGEKHPLPLFIMDSLHGVLYPILKLIMVLSIIYLIDTPFEEELKKYPNLGNLLKLSILILGFSPGLRDLLRVLMGT